MSTSIKKYVIMGCLFTVGLQTTMYVKPAVEQATSFRSGIIFFRGLCFGGGCMGFLVGKLASAEETKAATEVNVLRLTNQNTTDTAAKVNIDKNISIAEAKVNAYRDIDSFCSFFGLVCFAMGVFVPIYRK